MDKIMPGPWSRAATVANDIFLGSMHPDQEPFAVSKAVWEPRAFGRNILDLGSNAEQLHDGDPELVAHIEDLSQYRHRLFDLKVLERAAERDDPPDVRETKRTERRKSVEGLAQELEFLHTVGQSSRINDFLILHKALYEQIENRVGELDAETYHIALKDLEMQRQQFAGLRTQGDVIQYPITMDSQRELHEASVALVQKVKGKTSNGLREPAEFNDVIDNIMHQHKLAPYTSDGSDVRLGLRTLAEVACGDEPAYKLKLLPINTMNEVRTDIKEGAPRSVLGAAFNILHPTDTALLNMIKPGHEDDRKLETALFDNPNRPPAPAHDLQSHQAGDGDLRAYAKSLASIPVQNEGQHFSSVAWALRTASICSQRELASAEQYRQNLKKLEEGFRQAHADGEITDDLKNKIESTVAKLRLPLGSRAATLETREKQFRDVRDIVDQIAAHAAAELPASSQSSNGAEVESNASWKSFFEKGVRRLEALRERGEFHQHTRDAENIRFKADYAVLNSFIVADDWQAARQSLDREVAANTSARFTRPDNPIRPEYDRSHRVSPVRRLAVPRVPQRSSNSGDALDAAYPHSQPEVSDAQRQRGNSVRRVLPDSELEGISPEMAPRSRVRRRDVIEISDDELPEPRRQRLQSSAEREELYHGHGSDYRHRESRDQAGRRR